MQPEFPQTQKNLNTWQQVRMHWQRITANPDSRLMRLSRIVLKTLLMAYFVFCALFLCMRYIVLPQVGQYKPNVEKILAEELGHPVTISKIDASWYGFYPILKLDELVLHAPDGKAPLRLPKVKMAISWRSFFALDLRLAFLEIDRPELNIFRDKTGRIFIAGFPVDGSENKEKSGLDWVLEQNTITIHEGTVRWLDHMRDAPELALKELNFILKNDGQHHRMRFLASSNMTQSGEIDIRAHFVHPLFQKKHSDISKWKGEIYVALPDTALQLWKPYIDLPQKLKKATGSIHAWIRLDEAKIADLTMDANLSKVAVQLEPDLPVLNLHRISGRVSVKELFDVASDKTGFALGKRPHAVTLTDLSLETADGLTVEGFDFSENYRPAVENRPESTEITVNDLDLAAIIKLAKYLPLPVEQQKVLRKILPSGTLDQLTARWEGNYPDLSLYHLSGKFSNVSMNAFLLRDLDPEKTSSPLLEIPGFKNLTGKLSINEHEGSIELNSKDAVLNPGAYFPKPDWNFNDLALQANWTLSAENQLDLAIDRMDFVLDGVSGSVAGKYSRFLNRENPDDFGTIDLTAQVKSVDVAKVKQFVPLKTAEALRTWLTRAFEKGTANNVDVHLKGELSRFPFVNQEKVAADDEFRVRMDISNATLNYAPTLLTGTGEPAWKSIEKINGFMTIKGPEIAIHADSAELNKVTLSEVDVVIPDMLSDQVLVNVTGKANGELQHFVDFTNASPINDVIGGLTEEAKTKGPADLILKMQLPLSDMDHAKVQGTLQFSNNDIVLFPALPVLTATQGKVHFSDEGFDLENIKAQFLGGNVQISGGTKNGDSIVKANGTITAEGLQKNYTGSLGKLMKKLSGSMPYTLSIVHKAQSKSGYPDVLWESDMKGFGINLPEPLGKSKSDSRKLHVTANALETSGKTKRDTIKISYGSTSAAHYERQKVNRTWQLTRGGIGINTKPVLRQGVFLNLRMKDLNVNTWLDILNELMATGNKSAGNKNENSEAEKYVDPQQFFIQADKLTAMDFVLTDAVIRGSQKTNSWQAYINSNELKGNLIWEESAKKEETGKLIAHFSNLVIPRSEPEKIEDIIKRDSIRNIPTLDLIVDNLTLFDIKLGHVELVANNITHQSGREWRLSRLDITNPDAKLHSTGNWIIDKTGAKKTSMVYTLDIFNAGKLLDRFGYKKILSAGKGKMTGNINWLGLPYSLDIPTLSGQMELNIGKGQFLKVDPGIAKLLGVFSLQSLPRRLTLDFRDVFSKGFAFDEIVARVDIDKGIAKTENMTMKGVQATVLMNGSVDIVKETQDLHVAILPEINAGAASLVYSLINPAVGVGSFLAQLFLQNPLSKTFTYEYQITGSWTEPNIKKVQSKETRTKKTKDPATSTDEDEI